MSLIYDLITALRREAEASGALVEEVRIGLHFTGVKLTTGFGGVAYTPLEGPVKTPHRPARSATGLGAEEALGWAKSPNPLESALGVATMNALSHKLLFIEGEFRRGMVLGGDAFESLDVRGGDDVVMVGGMAPLVERLKGRVKSLRVIERQLEREGEVGVKLHSETEIDRLLPGADVVIVTGATVVNHTIDRILSLSKGAREIALVGPTTSMIPQPLFKRGVTLMGGVRIDDSAKMLRVVGEAGGVSALLRECAVKFTILRE